MGKTTHTLPLPRFPAPPQRFEQQNEAQFRREIERSYQDMVAFIGQISLDPLAIADHVLADDSGLGPQHTVSGLSSGEVLRATGATAAKFSVLDFTDLSGKIADAQVDNTVTYTNLQALNTLHVESPSGGQAMLIDGGSSRYINFGNTGFAGPAFTTYSIGVKIVLKDDISGSLAGATIGIDLSGDMFFGVSNTARNFEWFAGTDSLGTLSQNAMVLPGVLRALTLHATTSAIVETTLNMGTGTIPGGAKPSIFWKDRLTNSGDIGGEVSINIVGVIEDVIIFKREKTQFSFNPVHIDGKLTTDNVVELLGNVNEQYTFTTNVDAKTSRMDGGVIHRFSKTAAEVQSTWNETGTAPQDWGTIRHELFRVSSLPPNSGDVLLFSPVSYIPVTGGPQDLGWFKWYLPSDPVNKEVNLDVKADLVTIKGDLTVEGSNPVLSVADNTPGEERVLGAVVSSGADDKLMLGGGDGGFNAISLLEIYTSKTVNTTTGVLAADLTGEGTKSVWQFRGHATVDQSLDVTGGFFAGITALSTVGAPTVTRFGSDASTTWGYKVVAKNAVGQTLASSETTTTVGPATLNGTDFNRITWTIIAGAVTYDVYRSTAGGTPNTTGKIGSGTDLLPTLDDTGLSVSGSEPAVNSTAFVGIGVAVPTAAFHVAVAALFDTTVTFGAPTQDYLFTGDGAALAIQGQTSATTAGLHLFTKDGDGTDSFNFRLYAKGTPGATADFERLNFKYKSSTSIFELMTTAGGSGTVRPLHIYTGANSSQIVLNTDGTVTFDKMITSTATEGLRVVDDAAFVSFYDTAGTTRSGYLKMSTSGFAFLTVQINQGLKFRTNNLDRLTITSAGAFDFAGSVTISDTAAGNNLNVNNTTNDVVSRLTTDKVNGLATFILENDAQVWYLRCGSDDQFYLRDNTAAADRLIVSTAGAFDFQGNPVAMGALTATTTKFNTVVYTWPGADGASGEVLSTNGAGTLSWAAAAVGDAVKANNETITGNWTFSHASGILIDDILERSAAAGVTIDGLLIKDSGIPQAAVTAHEAAINHDALTNFDVNEHFTQAAIVATGALNSGSITSGFGNIDIGSSTLGGGALTVTTGTFSGNVLIGTTIAATGDPRLDVKGSPAFAMTNVTTDATTKGAEITVRHYTNAEENVVMLRGLATSNANKVQFGGSDSVFNTATVLEFYTAATTTSLTGTLAADIAGVGTASILRLRGDLSIDKDLNHDGDRAGFFATAPVAKPTGVAVTAAGIHAALVTLGLIAA